MLKKSTTERTTETNTDCDLRTPSMEKLVIDALANGALTDWADDATHVALFLEGALDSLGDELSTLYWALFDEHGHIRNDTDGYACQAMMWRLTQRAAAVSKIGHQWRMRLRTDGAT